MNIVRFCKHYDTTKAFASIQKKAKAFDELNLQSYSIGFLIKSFL